MFRCGEDTSTIDELTNRAAAASSELSLKLLGSQVTWESARSLGEYLDAFGAQRHDVVECQALALSLGIENEPARVRARLAPIRALLARPDTLGTGDAERLRDYLGNLVELSSVLSGIYELAARERRHVEGS